jgi:hypothetical protein
MPNRRRARLARVSLHPAFLQPIGLPIEGSLHVPGRRSKATPRAAGLK